MFPVFLFFPYVPSIFFRCDILRAMLPSAKHLLQNGRTEPQCLQNGELVTFRQHAFFVFFFVRCLFTLVFVHFSLIEELNKAGLSASNKNYILQNGPAQTK